MKKFTNHAPGARGIRTMTGLVMLEPGESASIDPKEIVEPLPDLGSAPIASDDDELVKAVEDENADLKKQVEALTKERDELVKAVEATEKALGEATAEIEKLKAAAKVAK
ncbi:hypothetical protein [Sphingomonas koreensis]